MIVICKCGSAARNTGRPTCFTGMGEAKKLFMQRTFDDSGALNKILPTDTMNQAWLDALINNADPSKRLYPIGDFIEVDQEAAEAEYEEYRDKSKDFLSQGLTEFTGLLKKYHPAYKAVLDSYRCGEWSAYVVDRNGVFIGYSTDDSSMTGRRLSTGSAAGRVVYEQQGGNVQKLEFKFQWHPKTDDSCLVIDSSATADFDGAMGLLDAFAYKADGSRGFDVASATEFSCVIKSAYGGLITGLLSPDFTLKNLTTDLAVVVTASEGANSLYTFTILAQTAADIMKMGGLATGYDLSTLGNQNIIAQ